jgi:hypothetical protein
MPAFAGRTMELYCQPQSPNTAAVNRRRFLSWSPCTSSSHRRPTRVVFLMPSMLNWRRMVWSLTGTLVASLRVLLAAHRRCEQKAQRIQVRARLTSVGVDTPLRSPAVRHRVSLFGTFACPVLSLDGKATSTSDDHGLPFIRTFVDKNAHELDKRFCLRPDDLTMGDDGKDMLGLRFVIG